MIVRQRLANCRRYGWDFDAAWESAVYTDIGKVFHNGYHRKAWITVFEDTRPFWKSAYLGEAADRKAEALSVIAA